MLEQFKTFILGPMEPDGTYQRDGLPHHDEPRFVHSTHTTRLFHIVEGIYQSMRDANDPVIADLSLEVATPDQQWGNGIIQNVLAQVDDADLILVDATGNNGTVMYELGAVHALGIPYIIVTADGFDEVPFYLRQLRIVPDFTFSENFDAAAPTHNDLKLKIAASIKSRDTSQFSTSAVSDYFQGFPIVNISGPASMASSYHINTVVRFCAQGSGFMARQTKLMADGWSHPEETRLRALCVIIPDLLADANFDAARHRLEQDLAAAGLTLESVSILEPSGDETRFAFGGMVLAQDRSIVIDIPRNMFTMKHVPRVMTARSSAARGQAAQATRRQLNRLRREYKDIILWHLNGSQRPIDDGWWDNAHVIDQQDAAAYIKGLLAD